MADLSYRLSMPSPHSHLLEVEMRIAGLAAPLDLVMPSWTPGSYLLREFARHVQDFRAETADGAPVAWSKTDKCTWRVDAPPDGPVRVRYRVYANELSVRTSHLDATHAAVNGASVFLFVRGREREPLEVEVEAPEGWRVTTSLAAEGPFRFRARDYDELVDSPLEIGTHELLEWEQSGIPHRYAIWGRGNHDPERLVADTKRIVEAAALLFGGLPYASYTFLVHLVPDGGGGLEHRDSTLLQADRWTFEGEEYEKFLALVAHEFFHVWNAKRIRPAPLGPFDYTRENYTTSLWVVEGLTTYYTELLLVRAGIITPERCLARLAEMISRFEALPGKRHQSLAESSFDTWIRFYRPDEHTPNAQVSYYQKGALVGLLLDMEIRRASGNERSLDDLMRLLWERYGAWDTGFPESGEGSVEALAAELAGVDLSDFFARYVRGTAELDYASALAVAGVEMTREPATATAAANGSGAAAAGPMPAQNGRRPADAQVLEGRLGIRARDQNGRPKIANVLEGSAAWEAGLNAADEVVALDGLRVSSVAELAKRVWAREAGERVPLAVFRRDELLTLEVEVGAVPAPKLKLARIGGERTAEQEGAWAGWVGSPRSLDPVPAVR